MQPAEHGEDWICFSDAARYFIEELFRCSAGFAETTLRGLCASGEVRSIRTKYTYIHHDGEPERVPENATFIRPSEWRTTEVDFEGDIDVSEEDLVYWVRRQGSAQATDPEDAAIERLPRPQWKQAVAKKAIAELWPDGIPEDLVNGQIEQRVGERLKEKGAVPISRDTILRAAGRK
jgi:hypothetical protein